jgi:hypothetical protein
MIFFSANRRGEAGESRGAGLLRLEPRLGLQDKNQQPTAEDDIAGRRSLRLAVERLERREKAASTKRASPWLPGKPAAADDGIGGPR